MTSKYGVSCTHGAWPGWPLRVGHFGQSGAVHDLVAPSDAVLVWSGGTSEVALHERRARGVERHALVRKSGMIDLLPSGTHFEEIAWRGETSACISINFEPARLARWLGAAEARELAGLRLGLVDAHVVDLVQRLRAQAIAGQPWGSLYVESLSLALASYVYARYAGAERREPVRAALPVDALIRFIEEHLEQSIGLLELAAIAGYSPQHFTRLFKQAFGRSPHQYVLERRIERAKSLLRDRGLSITSVALQCGFASQAHFNTAFKARTGLTPGAYRKG